MNWDKHKPFKITALICYLLIMLQGSFIALPFGFWLIFIAFEFGNPDQFFAFLGCLGIILTLYNLKKTNKKLKFEGLAFLLLIAPILRLLFSIPIKAFNYPSFIIPTALFVLFYFLSVLYLSDKPSKRV